MKNNLQQLKIDYNGASIFVGGTYNPVQKTIALNPLSDKSGNSIEFQNVLIHELHHMASSLGRIDNFVLDGFAQIKTGDNSSHIGKGLNEGYTEYLTQTMLKVKDQSYKKVVELIPLIELFYDNKLELRQGYFNVDLPSVIQKFSKIDNKESIIELIRDIDKLFFYSANKTWFDKSEQLDLNIRIKLYDYYKKLSGYSNQEELFFKDDMLEKIYTKTKI